MARYKGYSYDQSKLLPIRYSEQILPGIFEHTLHHVIGEIDLTQKEKAIVRWSLEDTDYGIR